MLGRDTQRDALGLEGWKQRAWREVCRRDGWSENYSEG